MADLFLKLEVELAGRVGDALESLLSPSSHLHLSPPSVTQMAETRIFFIYIIQNISFIDQTLVTPEKSMSFLVEEEAEFMNVQFL
jgi:hypothetical protein